MKEMKRVVRLWIPKAATPYRGLLFSAIRYVDGEFYNYEDLPDRAVLVAKHGSRFLNLNLGPFPNRKFWWVELVAAPPEDREELDLPREYGGSLELPTVILTTTRSKKWFLVVSEEAWNDASRWPTLRWYLIENFWAMPEFGDPPITLGGDPEFEVVKDGRIVPADTVPIFKEGLRPATESPIGLDGAPFIAELRPDYAYSEEEYVENFWTLVKRVQKEGILLSVKGDEVPLGGHIHVGSSDRLVVRVLRYEDKKFVQVLDDFIGRVLLPTSGKARGEYKRLGAYRTKDYGWEYRTPPSSFYADPEMVRIVYKLTRNLVRTLLKERELAYEVLDDGRAKPEEYLRFLTSQETEYFLGFPERWARGEISPFVPMDPAVSVAAG
jgi:hypothetical protein